MKYSIIFTSFFAGISLFAGVPDSAEETVPLRSGATVPNVDLADINGHTVNLKAKVSDNPSVLVFYRGSWCPYCNKHLSSLMDIEDDLETLGYELIAISPDKPAKLKEAIVENQLGYTLLSDSSAEAAKAFGLAFKVGLATRTLYKGYGIDLKEASGQDHYILPVPAVYIVGGDGVISYVYTNPDYKVRLSADELLEAARAGKQDQKDLKTH